MKRPVFLSVEDAVYIHDSTIRGEGGLGGIRDYALLESSVMMPQQQFGGRYLHKGIPAMAGAYLYHIVGNHPFHDGNKRTGAMAGFVFLDVNGFDLAASEKQLERTVQAVAAGNLSKSELAEWMRKHTKRRRA